MKSRNFHEQTWSQTLAHQFCATFLATNFNPLKIFWYWQNELKPYFVKRRNVMTKNLLIPTMTLASLKSNLRPISMILYHDEKSLPWYYHVPYPLFRILLILSRFWPFLMSSVCPNLLDCEFQIVSWISLV